MRGATAAILILLATPSTGVGAGLNLSWNDCGLAGVQNRMFACATNTGTNKLVASFQTHTDIADAVGWDMRIDLQSADATDLNPWWQMFNSGSCRGGAVPTVNVQFGTSCEDFFAGAGGGGVAAYTINANRAFLWFVWAVPDPAPLFEANEYYAMNVVINNTRTVGTPSCTGCATGVLLLLAEVAVAYGPNATLMQKIDYGKDRQFVCWQCGCGAGSNGVYFYNCPVTPTLRQSWGQIKSLYR